jgi:hypothetical protein
MMAPITAMPSAPPTWRMLFRTADPTPALSTGTEPIAAAVVGVITIAIPNPPTRRPGRTSQKFEVCVEPREDQERGCKEDHPAAHEPPRTNPVRVFPGYGGHEDDENGHRQERGARLDRRPAEDVLDEERVVEEDPEHREADE